MENYNFQRLLFVGICFFIYCLSLAYSQINSRDTLKHIIDVRTPNVKKQDWVDGEVKFTANYGFLPMIITSTKTALFYNTLSGNIDLNISFLPLNLSFFYTPQKLFIGGQNYFRLRYDSQKYRENMKRKLQDSIEKIKQKQGMLYEERQDIIQKMSYIDYIKNYTVKKHNDQDSVSQRVNSEKNNINIIVDSINVKKDTGTINYYEYNIFNTDSISELYVIYQNRYKLINDSIDNISNTIKYLENQLYSTSSITSKKKENKLNSNAPIYSRWEAFLSRIRKFDLGLSYPLIFLFFM